MSDIDPNKNEPQTKVPTKVVVVMMDSYGNPTEVTHEGATSFDVDLEQVLRLYDAHRMLAVYAPNRWGSAVLQ